MDQFIYLVAFFIGAGITWWFLRARINDLRQQLQTAQDDEKRLAAELGAAQQTLADLREKIGAADSTVANKVEQVAALQREKDSLAKLRDELVAEQQRLSNQVTKLAADLNAERNQAQENLAILNNAKAELSNQFKVLANEILEEKSQRFTAQNQTNLNQLLQPLNTKIIEFQGKVHEVYVQEGKDRTALAEQVKQLMVLNKQLSDDAHNLTRALKGQAKTQGNWGEFILERVLEASGLRRGHEYDVQESHTRSDGSRAMPDVVVHLPEERHLIIDAKVSLTAYEEFSNAETDIKREIFLKRHLDSVRTHIKELSEKNYQHLYALQSLDFVLMFIPVEPAFMLAISNDSDLWQEAWKKNVLLVSPSTLLFVVRTVAHLWRQEQQSKNAQEIANRGKELYDKLVGFVDDLETIGEKLKQAQKAYDGAKNKFSSGQGNVIRQAQMLKDLGVKPSKNLPQELVEASQDEPLVLPPKIEMPSGKT